MEAGRAQGQMYANLGKQVSGAIEQYGLNKEKQKKADARVKSAMNGMGEFVQAGVLSPEQKTMADEFLNDPTKSSAEKVAFIEEQEKRLFQLPKMQLAQAQAKDAANQAEIGKMTKDNEIAMSGLNLSARNLTNRGLELSNLINTAKSENERNKYRQEQEINKQQIVQLKEQTRGIKGKNDIFDLTKDDIIQQNKLKTAEIVQGLVLSSAQVEKLQKEMSLLGVNDAAERERLQAQIDNLKADAKNKLAEAELFQGQAEQIAELTSSTEAPSESSVFKLDSIEEGAQGDLFGIAKSKINALGDFFGLGTRFEESKDARAQVRSLRNALLPAFIGSFSERGSEWAKKTAEEILVNEDMLDGEFRAALKELPNKLKEKTRVDKLSLKRGLGTESEKLRMQKNIEEFPVLINDINRILEKDKQSGTAATQDELLNRFRR
tara:strand:+ start:22 stop:1329 length:1308 start_codon:yes stop_codon:yes gene_type:complete